jgi:alanine racemase
MNSRQDYRCWAEINRSALLHNLGVVRERIGAADILAVVKANAYGHGLVGVSEAIASKVQLFGVANLEEAIALRTTGLSHTVIILGPALPAERSAIVEGGFIPTISTIEEAEAFNRIGSVSINFKVDTGMGRMGVPERESLAAFKRISTSRNLRVHSVSTHMPVSNEDADYTRDQLARFRKVLAQFRAEVPGDYKAHVLQSAGTLAFNDTPHEIVRAGVMLYGISPLPEFQKLLRPAMAWKTRIALIRGMPAGHGISYGRTFLTPREMRVATLSAGYADGYPRHLSNRDAAVLVRGKRCLLLGRVTMDLMMIDVTDLGDAAVGDEAVLMGRQGDMEISASELAERADTITWEIITRIGTRVRRVYL